MNYYYCSPLKEVAVTLPVFRYHPDLLGTGSIVPSENVCECCGRDRGFIYTGPATGDGELDDSICPWCIGNDSAHCKLDAEFNVFSGVGGYVPKIELAVSIIEEVAFRTPGFTGWQQGQWLACCADAAAFIGIAGKVELETMWPAAIEAVKTECGYESDEWDAYYAALHKDSGPTAYVFRCLHCQKLLAYSDCH